MFAVLPWLTQNSKQNVTQNSPPPAPALLQVGLKRGRCPRRGLYKARGQWDGLDRLCRTPKPPSTSASRKARPSLPPP